MLRRNQRDLSIFQLLKNFTPQPVRREGRKVKWYRKCVRMNGRETKKKLQAMEVLIDYLLATSTWLSDSEQYTRLVRK
jgi:hypothetical protein